MENQMTVAMRVMQSAAIREPAAAEDAALLRAWAAPEDRNRAPDELACLVIEAELLRRKDGRTRRASDGQAAAAVSYCRPA